MSYMTHTYTTWKEWHETELFEDPPQWDFFDLDQLNAIDRAAVESAF